ncbi:SEC14 cytosolic factor [Teratosphaeria destructans]|uniref:SEC14 cytosolic factor n=1 Tax=Teratosphaeria destructans TaxID=418781 RepID=A0A9W7SLC1_9PEZI|nr:SEC14 cytosolic factor [Teratosphaeria destructans]
MSGQPAQDGGQLQRTESFQWPSGHVGHLSDSQQGALTNFKKLCQQKGYFVPASDDGKDPPSHDDETLLRYLRARKFVPEEAFGQFKETEDWRTENQLDTLYETIDIHEYEQTRRLYPQWTGRRDKRGIPFYVYEIQHVDSKAVSAYTSDKDAKNSGPSTTSKTPRKMLRLFALYENLCRFVLPLCSAIPGRPNGESPISQSSNLVDLSKVGFTKFWSLRNHMSDASKLATAHYPETLDRIFVVGAPSFFPTVWEWAKRWFDPITVSKIFILSEKNMKSTLEKYLDLDNVPKKYGGNLDWQFGDMPYLEPQIAQSLRWKENIEEKGHRTLPIGPIKWQYDEDGDLVATAIGTDNEKPRSTVIAGLHPEAGIARLALSPGRQEKTTLFTTMSGAHQAKSPSASAGNAKAAEAATDSANSSQEAPPPPYSPTSPSHTAPAAAGGVSALSNGVVVPAHDSQRAKMDNADPLLSKGKAEGSAVPDSSRAGTYTVPYRESNSIRSATDPQSPGVHPETGSAILPEDQRQGTSSTRFEQQHGTHVEGQLAEGTPHTKVDSQGEKQGIMEPNTVGQAPKEHPVPDPEETQPSIVEQAKEYAGVAYQQAATLPSTVMSAVGLGGEKKEEETKVEEGKKEDANVDNLDAKQVEEFLRHKSMSQPQPPGSK